MQNLFYDLQFLCGNLPILCKKTMKQYYHVSSHGLEKNDIFKNREDFVAGMNDVAICVLGFNVRVLCLCLMSNHFHFVLSGTEIECRRFSDEYKRRCAMRMRLNGGDVQGMRNVDVQIRLVDNQEYLENVIAYVLRNPLAAGVQIMPYHYPWSSALSYFVGNNQNNGEALNVMSERKRFRILKSRIAVPDHYYIDENGMIPPSCYVDVKTVESVFRHPSRFMMALARKVENDVEILLGVAADVSMTDQEILTEMRDLVRREFQKESLSQLSAEERIRLCLLLKRNFRAGIKQIARITKLDPALVSKVV